MTDSSEKSPSASRLTLRLPKKIALLDTYFFLKSEFVAVNHALGDGIFPQIAHQKSNFRYLLSVLRYFNTKFGTPRARPTMIGAIMTEDEVTNPPYSTSKNYSRVILPNTESFLDHYQATRREFTGYGVWDNETKIQSIITSGMLDGSPDEEIQLRRDLNGHPWCVFRGNSAINKQYTDSGNQDDMRIIYLLMCCDS
jgi:hypothetical protein